jgi:hypothetical protein
VTSSPAWISTVSPVARLGRSSATAGQAGVWADGGAFVRGVIVLGIDVRGLWVWKHSGRVLSLRARPFFF